jgi:hypothetical protein
MEELQRTKAASAKRNHDCIQLLSNDTGRSSLGVLIGTREPSVGPRPHVGRILVVHTLVHASVID